MPTKIQKWGNSLAVRIPKRVANRLRLRPGSEVFVEETDRDIILRKRGAGGGTPRKNDWRRFVVPTARRKENVSGTIDEILYGNAR